MTIKLRLQGDKGEGTNFGILMIGLRLRGFRVDNVKLVENGVFMRWEGSGNERRIVIYGIPEL